MDFSRQEYWSGLPFPLPVDLRDPGIKPVSRGAGTGPVRQGGRPQGQPWRLGGTEVPVAGLAAAWGLVRAGWD